MTVEFFFQTISKHLCKRNGAKEIRHIVVIHCKPLTPTFNYLQSSHYSSQTSHQLSTILYKMRGYRIIHSHWSHLPYTLHYSPGTCLIPCSQLSTFDQNIGNQTCCISLKKSYVMSEFTFMRIIVIAISNAASFNHLITLSFHSCTAQEKLTFFEQLTSLQVVFMNYCCPFLASQWLRSAAYPLHS